MATTAQALLSSANCHACYSASPDQLQAMLVALVRQWVLALNPSAVTDAQTLLTQAACHGCNAATPYELQMMLVALMIQVVNAGGGGGGSGSVLQYTGANPTADGITPTNINNPAVAYKADGTDATYSWNTTTHVWNP